MVYAEKGHTDIVGYSNTNWDWEASDRRLTSGYYILIGGALISWRSKTQSVAVKSSIDVDYHVMTHGKCKLKVCCHFIWEMILGGIINNSSVCSNDHPVDIFTKLLQHFRIACIYVTG